MVNIRVGNIILTVLSVTVHKFSSLITGIYEPADEITKEVLC